MDKKHNEKPTFPIVKISWIWHNREYEIGLKRFLEVLGADFSDDEIMIAVRKLLSEQE